jgi:hypothetical protein
LEDLAAVELLKMVELSLAVAMAPEAVVAAADKLIPEAVAVAEPKTLAVVAAEVELLF